MPKKKKKNNYYFTQETEDAIIKYNQETDHFKRSMIYSKEIKKSFEKLAEYIINTFKFPYLPETLKNKKAEVVSHLMLNIDKYDGGKGKAFSYFSKAAKTYLILKNNIEYNKNKKHYHLEGNDNHDNTNDASLNMIDVLEDNTLDEQLENDNVREFINEMILFFERNMDELFKKKDHKIAFAILQLMGSYNLIENFNKKAIYLMLRDMTNESATSITKIMNKMKEMYPNLYKEFEWSGTLKHYKIEK